MTEIEKMYENVGVEPIDSKFEPMGTLKFDVDSVGTTWTREQYMKEVPIYPPFTAEKQIELIKWLAKLDGHFEISCIYNKEAYLFNFYFNRKTEEHKNPTFPYSIIKSSDFVELLAKQINELWQSLTDQEKEEIRGILNE